MMILQLRQVCTLEDLVKEVVRKHKPIQKGIDY